MESGQSPWLVILPGCCCLGCGCRSSRLCLCCSLLPMLLLSVLIHPLALLQGQWDVVKAESDFLLLEFQWVIVMLKLARWELLPISLLTSLWRQRKGQSWCKTDNLCVSVNRSSGAISRHLGVGLQSCRSSSSLLSHGWTDPRPQALVSDSIAVFELF